MSIVVMFYYVSRSETQYDFKIGQQDQGNIKTGFHGFRESIVPSKGNPCEVHSISRFNSAFILPKCYLTVIHKMDSKLQKECRPALIISIRGSCPHWFWADRAKRLLFSTILFCSLWTVWCHHLCRKFLQREKVMISELRVGHHALGDMEFRKGSRWWSWERELHWRKNVLNWGLRRPGQLFAQDPHPKPVYRTDWSQLN